MSARRAERKASPLFEIARVPVRLGARATSHCGSSGEVSGNVEIDCFDFSVSGHEFEGIICAAVLFFEGLLAKLVADVVSLNEIVFCARNRSRALPRLELRPVQMMNRRLRRT